MSDDDEPLLEDDDELLDEPLPRDELEPLLGDDEPLLEDDKLLDELLFEGELEPLLGDEPEVLSSGWSVTVRPPSVLRDSLTSARVPEQPAPVPIGCRRQRIGFPAFPAFATTSKDYGVPVPEAPVPLPRSSRTRAARPSTL
ncbi:hypothetical protein [Streptosporangium sp. V21-05]|uniref:hypothetical protein n=1 Tax=Streptosporangium sp. V21-05 TaxID=3446115 RepID=UPI003F53CD8F